MIKVTSREFNNELDDYLANRKDSYSENKSSDKKSRWIDFFEKFGKNGPKPNEDEFIASDANDDFLFEEETYNEEPEEKSSSSKRRGFFARIFSWSGNDVEEEDVYFDESLVEEGDDSVEEELQDLKETIKILHTWLEKLSPEKINQFKRSSDYERYKAALDRLDLLKK